MSETKWTPGPWRINECRYGFSIHSNDTVIVNTEDEEGRFGPIHDESSAHLIAAAPDLYAALEQCLALAELKYGNTDDIASHVFGECRAALAKARGEK